MAGRTRSQKKLSQRIDREYFKRSYPIPRWRRLLTLGLSVVALGWVGWSSAARTGDIFNAGPLSKKHHILEGNCSSCHVSQSAFAAKVTEQACLTCHDGPQHMEQQASNPTCMSCHVEHQGAFALARVTDASCSQCHANLTTKDGKLNVEARVTNFDSGHPEFRALLAGARDPGTVKLNHEVHMKAGLRGPDGPMQLECASCHVRKEDGTMTAAVFEDHCESCHRLEFHRRVEAVLPHDKPDVVLAFARRELARYIATHPGDVNFEEPALDPRIMSPRPGPAGNSAEWIRRRMEETQTLMWRKTCVECHTPRNLESALPEIPDAAIPEVWMTRAWFDHSPHQMVKCEGCHAAAPTSKLTSDILLPGIDSCRSCHQSSGASADASCSECHVYHDWTKAKRIDGKFTIPEFRGR